MKRIEPPCNPLPETQEPIERIVSEKSLKECQKYFLKQSRGNFFPWRNLGILINIGSKNQKNQYRNHWRNLQWNSQENPGQIPEEITNEPQKEYL